MITRTRTHHFATLRLTQSTNLRTITFSQLRPTSPHLNHRLAISTMASSLSIKTTLPLPNTSIQIPQLGFGVYRSPTNVCVASCLAALKAGYRHIDTAQFYANETEVGEAVAQSGLKRSDIFLTTKILSAGGSVDASYKKCVESVKKLDPSENGYVDLFLIHSPNAGSKARKEMWLALEKLYEEGKAKSIGVSNWGIGHIDEIKEYGKVVFPPHVNQIEVSFRAYSQGNTDLTICSYTPGVSSARSSTIATSTRSSSRPTRHLCGTTRQMMAPYSHSQSNMIRLLPRYSFDTVCRKDGCHCRKAIPQRESWQMQMSMGSTWEKTT